MKNYKAVIEYDGTRYSGWQKQGNTHNTIQSKFEDILFKMTGRKCEIFSSGRTDAGVHAKGQVANFKADTDMTCCEIKEYLNSYLPTDIGVLSVEEVDERFHSRLNAKRKTYVYRMYKGSKLPVFERNYICPINADADIGRMREAAKFFLGTHDFKSFCTKKKMKKSTVRTIFSLDVCEKGNEIDIEICGNGFLYNMVRIISGTLLYVGLGKIGLDNIPQIIEAKDREKAGETMPAKGLCLVKVEY